MFFLEAKDKIASSEMSDEIRNGDVIVGAAAADPKRGKHKKKKK